MCDPLRGKKHYVDWESYGESHVYYERDVKSAVEFYKKYIWKLDDLRELNKDLYWKWHKYYHSHPAYLKFDYMRKIRLYNDWLFDYCFGDVIE